jgi:hypothetical protein
MEARQGQDAQRLDAKHDSPAPRSGEAPGANDLSGWVGTRIGALVNRREQPECALQLTEVPMLAGDRLTRPMPRLRTTTLRMCHPAVRKVMDSVPKVSVVELRAPCRA